MATQIEHTNTYGGEANYCWVRRYYCTDNLTDAQKIRLAKRVTGYTGYRCRTEHLGGNDDIAIRPAGVCHIIFISYVESEYAKGTHVNAIGEEVNATN